MSGGLDWVFVAVNVLGASAWIYTRSKREQDPLFVWMYAMLYLCHLGMGLYFFDYLLTNGGDSLAYWQPLNHAGFGEWMTGYGYGSYVMQAMNSPLIGVGVGYLGGTFLYNLLSFIGIGLIFEETLELLKRHQVQNSLHLILAFAVCIWPGLHFWTGGVSKESLLILAIGLVFRYAGRAGMGPVFLGFLGFFFALQVRLIAGLALFPLLLIPLGLSKKIAIGVRVTMSLIAAVLFVQGVRFMGVLTQVNEVSLESIQRVSSDQLEFLSDLGAKSHVPVIEMGFSERMLAVLFRPFPWEVWDIYSLVFALENMVLLMLTGLGIFFIIKHRMRIPLRMLGFFGMAIGMVLIYAFTLNNFGIIYRMKSIFLPFLSLPFIWALYRRFVNWKFIC